MRESMPTAASLNGSLAKPSQGPPFPESQPAEPTRQV